ncbi:MAG: SPOR domain-containing protein [Bacteroidetes bacterium]|nr:SPOR domain-containing protein [Bacteroidota bacterium]
MTQKGINTLTILITLVIVCIFVPSHLNAQNKSQGGIQINQDDRVDLLVQKHIQINQNKQGIAGYRIQIFFDSGNNSKTKAQGIYEEFIGKYPGIGAYLTFKAPNYKVRVGDFRTKLDAQRFLNEILTVYPSAWIIDDIINLPKVEQ